LHHFQSRRLLNDILARKMIVGGNHLLSDPDWITIFYITPSLRTNSFFNFERATKRPPNQLNSNHTIEFKSNRLQGKKLSKVQKKEVTGRKTMGFCVTFLKFSRP
jgi:hypothetical protein